MVTLECRQFIMIIILQKQMQDMPEINMGEFILNDEI